VFITVFESSDSSIQQKHAGGGTVPVGNQGHPGSISEASPFVWGTKKQRPRADGRDIAPAGGVVVS